MVEDLLFEDTETSSQQKKEEIKRKTADSFTPHVMVNTISTLAATPYDDKPNARLLLYITTLGNLPKQKLVL